MSKVLSAVASLALVAGALAVASVAFVPGENPVSEFIAGPLGMQVGDGDGDEEREIIVSNPSSVISKGTYDDSIVATTGGKPLKRVSATRPTKSQRDTLRPEAPKVRPAKTLPGSPDAALQTTVVGNAVTVGTGFAGMTLNSNGCGWPPDTSGDVGGPAGEYYVQAVNCSVAIYNTSNGSVAGGPWTLDSFMSAALGSGSACAANNQGDPVVSYDVVAQRWIVMDFWWTSTSGPYKLCIAVSNTSNPTGGWHGFAFDTTINGYTNWMPDYPKMALTPNGLAITANMFAGAQTYAGVGVYLLDKTSLYCVPGGGTTCSLKSFRWQLGSAYFSLLPANVRFPVTSGAASTVGAFLVSDYNVSNAVRVWTIAKPDWTGTTAPAIQAPVSVSVPSYTKPSFAIPQPSTNRTLDTLGDRLMNWAQVSDSATTATILLSRTATATVSTAARKGRVTNSTVAGVRWQVMNWNASTGTFSSGKGSTYAPDATHRWMPSAAINAKGEVAIGYSASSTSVYPEIRVAGASSSSVASASPTTDVAETVVRTGSGSQGSYGRWGDYASMSVDPAGCKFWYTTEYYTGGVNTNWRTWIQPFTLTSCP